MFMVVGKAKKMPFYENEKVIFKEGVNLGFTVDERIADGYYFSKSIKMLIMFLENPELLEQPLNEKLSDELWAKINMK